MKRLFASTQLLVMLLIIVLLGGFSYMGLPGRLELTPSNILSVAVDTEESSRYIPYKDPDKIQAAVKALTTMQQVDDNNSSIVRNADEKRVTFTIRVNFKDSSTQSYFGEYYAQEKAYIIHPFRSGGAYRVEKAVLDPLFQ